MLSNIFKTAKAHIRGGKSFPKINGTVTFPYHVGDLPPLIENNGYAYTSVLLGKFKIKDILGHLFSNLLVC